MKLPVVVLTALLLALTSTAHADSAESALFVAAEAAREQAEAAEALLLAPTGYGAGVQALNDARHGYQSGSSLDTVTALIEEASSCFRMAARNAGEARQSFAAVLVTRTGAREAAAFRLATVDWARAEKTLQTASRLLEAGDARGALERAANAEQLYAAAQLLAIKATLLTEARSELAALREARADRLAPKTSNRAADLLGRAEAELDADRSRGEAAQQLASEAVAVAQNARALATLLRDARETGITSEDLLIEWQESLARVAAAAGRSADFANGPRTATEAVVGEIAALQARSRQQEHDLSERDRQISSLEEEIRDLDHRLEGASSEARSASLHLAAQEHAREQLEQLEKLFTPGDALILRQGESVILRLYGLSFASGSSQLPPSEAELMEKIARSVSLYPTALVTVEGHTDSSGDSTANQRLSQARAEAVRRYLTGRLQMPVGQVSAVGYGDTRPISSNQDTAGRRNNRRIDLVITPPAGVLP